MSSNSSNQKYSHLLVIQLTCLFKFILLNSFWEYKFSASIQSIDTDAIPYYEQAESYLVLLSILSVFLWLDIAVSYKKLIDYKKYLWSSNEIALLVIIDICFIFSIERDSDALVFIGTFFIKAVIMLYILGLLRKSLYLRRINNGSENTVSY